MTISVIAGSTRQGRFSEKPAPWILHQLHKREGIAATQRAPNAGWHKPFHWRFTRLRVKSSSPVATDRLPFILTLLTH